jgi:hypothetical protein
MNRERRQETSAAKLRIEERIAPETKRQVEHSIPLIAIYKTQLSQCKPFNSKLRFLFHYLRGGFSNL